MTCERRPLATLDDTEIEAWRDLARRAAEPNPFFEPELVLPAARHLAGGDQVRLVVVRDGAEWLACLPVVLRPRWRALRLPCLTTWLHPHCFLGTPLLDATRIEEAAAALAGLPSAGSRALLSLEWMGDDGPVAEAISFACRHRGLSAVAYERFARAALRRRPEATYLDGGSASRRRKDVRRTRRGLERALGAPATVRDSAADPGAPQRFLALERTGWKGRAGTAMACDPTHAAFFADASAALGAKGRLQLLELTHGDTTVAMQANVLAGDTIFCLKVANDERHARFSPGVALEVDAVDWFHRETAAAAMDSCAEPTNRLMNTLWPDRRPIASYVLPADGPVGRIARWGAVAAVALRERPSTS